MLLGDIGHIHLTLQAETLASRNIPVLQCLKLFMAKMGKGQDDFNCTSPAAQYHLQPIMYNIK